MLNSEEQQQQQKKVIRGDSSTVLELNSDRFLGVAEIYDSSRPAVPPSLCEAVVSYLGRKPRVVVDLGCGTGLSTRPWVPFATERVIGIDPNPEMLEQARKVSNEPPFYKQGYAHKTGLPDKSVDIVTFAHAFHWVDHKAVLAEVNRILTPGGILAIIDVVWPPSITGCWRSERAFERSLDLCKRLVVERGFVPPFDASVPHYKRLKAEETFSWVRQMYFSSEEKGTWHRLVHLLESNSPVNVMLSNGISREECLITELEKVSKEEMGEEPRKWTWGIGVVLALK